MLKNKEISQLKLISTRLAFIELYNTDENSVVTKEQIEESIKFLDALCEKEEAKHKASIAKAKAWNRANPERKKKNDRAWYERHRNSRKEVK